MLGPQVSDPRMASQAATEEGRLGGVTRTRGGRALLDIDTCSAVALAGDLHPYRRNVDELLADMRRLPTETWLQGFADPRQHHRRIQITGSDAAPSIAWMHLNKKDSRVAAWLELTVGLGKGEQQHITLYAEVKRPAHLFAKDVVALHPGGRDRVGAWGRRYGIRELSAERVEESLTPVSRRLHDAIMARLEQPGPEVAKIPTTGVLRTLAVTGPSGVRGFASRVVVDATIGSTDLVLPLGVEFGRPWLYLDVAQD